MSQNARSAPAIVQIGSFVDHEAVATVSGDASGSFVELSMRRDGDEQVVIDVRVNHGGTFNARCDRLFIPIGLVRALPELCRTLIARADSVDMLGPIAPASEVNTVPVPLAKVV